MEDDIEGPFYRAGADGTLLEDFRKMSATERYPRTVLLWLARFISGTAGGPNKDSPIFELCHLAYAVDILTASNNEEGRTLFFLGPHRAIPRTIKNYLDTEVNSNIDQVRIYKDSIFIEYGDDQFHVKFGRMPALIALYDFLASMEDFAFYAELSDHLNGIRSQTKNVSLRSIKDATNKIASRLRQYRRTHMMWAANNEKFDRILPFLKARGDGTHLIIDDAAVLDFWTLHSQGKEFRGYKTVLDSFVTFQRALQVGQRVQAAEQTAVLGADTEADEIDLADQDYDLSAFSDWTSPFQILDEDQLKKIKFFKSGTERKQLDPMMRYGPDAIRLPLAFLRLESFAPIQTGITTDLQVKRGRESVERRITCTDAASYSMLRDSYAKLLEHVRMLQKAVLHGILATQGKKGPNVVMFADSGTSERGNILDIDTITKDASIAFQQLTRRGFETITGQDDERGETFRHAAGALIAIAHVLRGMLDAVDRLDNDPVNLEAAFESDQKIFSTQFSRIYSVKR